MSILRHAVEEAGISDDRTIFTDDRELTDLAAISESVTSEPNDPVVTLESLVSYREAIESLLSHNLCTEQTAQSVCKDAMVLASQNQAPGVQKSLEAFEIEADVVRQHELALEGVLSSIKYIVETFFQTYIVYIKNICNKVRDFISTTDTLIDRYESRLKKTKNEYLAKRRGFKEGDHEIALHALWQFFSTERGPAEDIVEGLAFDTAASSHILDEYPNLVLKELEKIVGLLKRGKIKDDKSAIAFFKSFESLKNTEEFFDKKYVGEGILYDVRSIRRVAGRIRNPVTVAGESLGQFTDTSMRIRFVESGSLVHFGLKVVTNFTRLVELIRIADLNRSARVSTAGIADVIAYGEDYIKGVKAHNQTLEKFYRVLTDVLHLFEKGSFIENPDIKGLDSGLTVLMRIIDNYVEAIQTPAAKEVHRAIMGAKYCNYIALRLIYNATPYF